MRPGSPGGIAMCSGAAGVEAGGFVERCRQAILQIIREHWADYFPDLRAAPAPRVTMPKPAGEHGYSIIQEYAVLFDEVPARREVIAKVRRGARWAAADDAGATVRAASLARTEFEALSRAHEFFGRLAGECHVVRPITYIDAFNAVLLEKARGRDLGDLVRGRASGLPTQFHRCGRWLRYLHRDVHRWREQPWSLERYEEGIRDRLETLRALGVPARDLDDLGEQILTRARAFHGAGVPVSMLHGDLKLRHVWGRAEGIEVLDFGNVHEGECYKDVAAFLVEIGVLTLGRPWGRADRAGYSRAFLDGYLQGERPSPLLPHYVVDSLLKKWGRRIRRWGGAGVPSLAQRGLERLGAKRAVDRLWLDRWFRREIETQLALTEGRP